MLYNAIVEIDFHPLSNMHVDVFKLVSFIHKVQAGDDFLVFSCKFDRDLLFAKPSDIFTPALQSFVDLTQIDNMFVTTYDRKTQTVTLQQGKPDLQRNKFDKLKSIPARDRFLINSHFESGYTFYADEDVIVAKITKTLNCSHKNCLTQCMCIILMLQLL